MEGLPHMAWTRPDQFHFIQPTSGPKFAYVTHDGWRIEPRTMSTDGASIPRWLWWDAELSPWRYAPAAIVHDWLFEVHHRLVRNGGHLDPAHYSPQDVAHFQKMTVQEAADIYAEAMKTLMESHKASFAPQPFILWAQHAATESSIAQQLWNKQPGTEEFRQALAKARRREAQWPRKPPSPPVEGAN